MATVRTVMDALVSIVEGVTVDTVYCGTKTFRHDGLEYAAEDAKDHQSPTRRFVIVPTGQREPGGAHGSVGSPIHVTQVFDLSVLYRMGSSASELFRVVAEDVDQIGWELLKAGNWDQINTNISRIRAGGWDMSMDDGGPAGTAIVSIPIEVFYRPSFTG